MTAVCLVVVEVEAVRLLTMPGRRLNDPVVSVDRVTTEVDCSIVVVEARANEAVDDARMDG